MLNKFIKNFGFFYLEDNGINRNPYKLYIIEEGKLFLQIFYKVNS